MNNAWVYRGFQDEWGQAGHAMALKAKTDEFYDEAHHAQANFQDEYAMVSVD